MANMGSTGTVKVEAAMIVNAIAAINTYQTTINSINASLKNEIDNLIPSSFSGSAADGYKVFFENSIYLNITTNLTSLLCSPPFVPPVVGAMKNKKVLISGIAIGLVGYAVGTYLGVLIAYILN